MPRNVSTVAAVCGPLILISYLVGATVRSWLISRGSLTGPRSVADPRSDPDVTVEAGDTNDPAGTNVQSPSVVIEMMTTIGVATFGWHAIQLIAPGGTTSSIASGSPQVLTVWQSVALWAGLAAMVGHLGPIWNRFEHGGTGLPSAIGLLAIYAPMMLLLGLSGLFGGMILRRSPNDSIPVALAAVVTGQWIFWWFDLPWAWGMFNGPELALWITVASTALFARWLKGDML